MWRALLDIAPTSQAACEQLCMLLLQGALKATHLLARALQDCHRDMHGHTRRLRQQDRRPCLWLAHGSAVACLHASTDRLWRITCSMGSPGCPDGNSECLRMECACTLAGVAHVKQPCSDARAVRGGRGHL